MPEDISNRQIMIDTLRSVALWLALFLPACIVTAMALRALGVPSHVAPAAASGLCAAAMAWLRGRLRRRPTVR